MPPEMVRRWIKRNWRIVCKTMGNFNLKSRNIGNKYSKNKLFYRESYFIKGIYFLRGMFIMEIERSSEFRQD
jgi:hypothetical protein